MKAISKSNDPRLESWMEVPAPTDFPIQNLPFGICKTRQLKPRAVVAIGEFVVDLAYLHRLGYFSGVELPKGIFEQPTLNAFFALGRKKIRAVRDRMSTLLRADTASRAEKKAAERALIPQKEAEMLLPLGIPNYTDFYSSEEHAINVGSMFRDPKNPLLPNWKHMPVAYHGRTSSIVVSGTPIRRPKGQIKPAGRTSPELAATRKLDFELELAFVLCRESKLGQRIAPREADDYIAGFALFNDWSARDIQQWEYVPLGPFLGKDFASTLSPWIVTLDALEPFRVSGPKQEPEVLPYLTSSGKNHFDITLEASLLPASGKETVLCRSNAKYLYWSAHQQLAHHTVNGCNVKVGDVYASGTISGPSPGSFGSMLELSWNGEKPLTLADGSTRGFLEDGDTVRIQAYAEKNGVRIGFGHCDGKILKALP